MLSRIIPPRSVTATIIPAIGGASSSSDHSSALKSAFLVIQSPFDLVRSGGVAGCGARLADGVPDEPSPASRCPHRRGADTYPPRQTATHHPLVSWSFLTLG